MSSFKNLQHQQDEFFGGRGSEPLEKIHQSIDQQQGIFRLFADVAELFIPQSVNTIFRMIGSGEDVVKPHPPLPFDDHFNLPGGRG